MTDLADLATRVARIEDWIALQALMGEYRDAADAFDFVRWTSLFTEDAYFDQKGTVFADLRGRQLIYDRCVEQVVGNWEMTQHALANCTFTIDGDRASGAADMLYTALRKGAKNKSDYFQGFSHYRMNFVRTPQGWKIKELFGNPIADTAGKSWAEVFGQQDKAAASD